MKYVWGRSMKILIIDDSPVSRKMLKSCIPKDQEIQFLEASDGLEGLNSFIENSPDLTFLDLTMPVMDGAQALEAIKLKDPDAVVIISTADIQAKSIERVEQLGAFLVLKKPPTKESVAGALQQVAEYRKSR
jgi:two-component system, chemotaxis family, chemotaxis protein CheY